MLATAALNDLFAEALIQGHEGLLGLFPGMLVVVGDGFKAEIHLSMMLSHVSELWSRFSL